MANYFLASVADATLFDGNQLFGTSTTLSESGISTSISLEDVRAGKGNKLFAKYAHSAGMELTLTDVMFKIQNILAQTGGIKAIGGDAIAEEQCTCSTAGQLTLAGTAVNHDEMGMVAWVAKVGSDNFKTCNVDHTGKIVTVDDAQEDDIYCVKYFQRVSSATQITIPANFIPKTLRVILKADLFSGGGTTQTKVGYVVIEIPRLMMNGTLDLSMTATGVSNTSLSGTALAVKTGGGCEAEEIYARILEYVIDENPLNGASMMCFADGDFTVENSSGRKQLEVYAVVQGSVAKVDPALLTFTVDESDVGSVDTKGLFTAGSSSKKGTIKAVGKGLSNSPEAICQVTVE